MKNLDLGCKIVMGSLELEEAFKCTGQVMPYFAQPILEYRKPGASFTMLT
jgi:hypothetical protein